jgi:glycosyltransferase involved in cell wall biosynthesis
MSAVDIVALTTRWPDPLPRVVMEAMAVGRPVIAYEGGGVGEMVVDQETGLLIDSGDVNGLAEAMVSLGRDEELRRQLGGAARERAARLFSVDRHVDRMESLFRQTIGPVISP